MSTRPLGDASWAPVPALSTWPVPLDGLDPAWRRLVDAFLASPPGLALGQRLQAALAQGQTLYPSDPWLALRLTPLSQVKVLILGQDPYHGPGQAEGLAFSVVPGQRIPPSLRNIFKERQRSLGLPAPAHGSLRPWAQQGVLLLNTSLTVAQGQPASHARWGWEALTDRLVQAVAARASPTVFMLWGGHAQAKRPLLDQGGPAGHLILEANHPSPLSAMRGPRPFLGCDHLRLANAFLQAHGLAPVAW